MQKGSQKKKMVFNSEFDTIENEQQTAIATTTESNKHINKNGNSKRKVPNRTSIANGAIKT